MFDYENVLKRIITKRQWKKDKASATIFKYYNKNDIEPYNAVYKLRRKQILQDIVLAKFRLYIVFVLDRIGLRK